MNAVEIEEAVSALAIEPFNRTEFPFAFLAAFGNKDATIQRLRAGSTNQSDFPGGVLQRNQIHLATCEPGKVANTLTTLRASPKNTKAKPKFVLATDGIDLEAEELATGEFISCKFTELGNQFGFFLPLAGISTVAEIKNNPIDIKATSRLNKLYVELLDKNPDWATAERRHELNQFMARLIFCLFAEDTGIFNSQGLFSTCIRTMTAPDSSNTHEVLQELFRAMDTPTRHNNVPDDRYRDEAGIKSWARAFPYVNGKLFSGKTDCPRFSKIARSYLIRAGELSWKEINPDIFGSMIQAVADDDERGELGMHYTSVPNILKVLDPLFLDDLREELEKAENNPRKLLNLRKRIANHAMAQACTIIEHERDWREDAELLAGGVVTVHTVDEAIPPESKPYLVTFTEEVTYARTVQARTRDHARTYAEQALKEGSSDVFEEIANIRSPFTIEEVRS